MKKIPRILSLGMGALLLTVLSGCRVYQDSGLWRGAAIYQDELHIPVACEMEVEITHSTEEIILHTLASDCGDQASRWRPGGFELDGSSVWRNGRIIGTASSSGSARIDLDAETVDEIYPFLAKRVTLSWARSGDRLQFSEEAEFKGRRRSVTGWLSRVR